MLLAQDVQGDELAALQWLLELGVDEAIGAEPINRFTVKPPNVEKPRPSGDDVVNIKKSEATVAAEAVAEAVALSRAINDVDGLRVALEGFDGCILKKGARNLVFADGNPRARVMVVGGTPGRNEDQRGVPFVGAAGQLLDRMFGAIGLSRASKAAERAVYLTNLMPWRPPQDRDPTTEEVALMLPFLMRHIELVDPQIIVLLGNIPAHAVLGGEAGIVRMRGNWGEVLGRAVMPMFHPDTLLRGPEKKREAWADLLAIQARLEGKPNE